MSVISGTAITTDGVAIDYVSVFNWADGKCIEQIIPNEYGMWAFSTNTSAQVGITYVANTYKPFTTRVGYR